MIYFPLRKKQLRTRSDGVWDQRSLVRLGTLSSGQFGFRRISGALVPGRLRLDGVSLPLVSRRTVDLSPFFGPHHSEVPGAETLRQPGIALAMGFVAATLYD